MTNHTGSLAEYVTARRETLGLTLTELAHRAGLSKSELSAIERGRVMLPGADKRRRLAEALRGTHAELLVAAGEIAPDEIVEGANAYDPRRAKLSQPFPENSPAAKVVEILRSLPDEQAAWVLGTARFAAKQARGEQDEEDLTVRLGTTRRIGT